MNQKSTPKGQIISEENIGVIISSKNEWKIAVPVG